MINDDDEFASTSSFLEYFPGLVVETESSGSSAIIGFSSSSSDLYMNLYYHRPGIVIEELEYKISLYDSSYQFNKIDVDRSGTVLDSWTEQKKDIPASLTNNQVFAQGITGVLTRVEFPTLDMFIELGDLVSLINAEVIFTPIKKTYSEIDVPSNTVLFQTDGHNRIYDPIYDIYGSAFQQGSTIVDSVYHEETSISFDLTNYFIYDFQDNYYDPDYGFLLGLYEDDNYKTFDRVILGGLKNHDYKPKLKIHYISYD